MVCLAYLKVRKEMLGLCKAVKAKDKSITVMKKKTKTVRYLQYIVWSLTSYFPGAYSLQGFIPYIYSVSHSASDG